MADRFDRLNRRNGLPPRPRDVVQAEQARHDRARTRGLIAVFAVLVVGGGLAAFIALGPLFRGRTTLQAVLVALVFVLPFLAALVMLSRVPPAPFESLTDPDREFDRRERERRVGLLSAAFNVGIFALQSFWLGPRLSRFPAGWPFVVLGYLPTLIIIATGAIVLYVKPGWSNPDLSALDDEVTRSFRVRAQSLGYLLLLIIFALLAVLGRISPALAARYLPLGVAVGVILPVLYFVFLDWQASRSG